MRRRQFITLIGGAAASLARPLPMWAQQSRTRRIGILTPLPERDADGQAEVTAFRERLSQFGWTDGRNVRIDYRWATSDMGRIHTAAKELVALQPDAILVRTTPGTAALLAETRTIPIVFVQVADPIGPGFVASMARPGGNATGFTNVEPSLGGKYVELLKELSPSLDRVAMIYNPATAPYAQLFLDSAEQAVRSFKLALVPIHAQNGAEIEHAIAAFAREPNGSVACLPDITTTSQRALIIALAAPLPPAGGLLDPHLRCSRRTCLLRHRPDRRLPGRRRLYRSYPSRRKTGGTSGARSGQVRTGHQCQHRQGAGP